MNSLQITPETNIADLLESYPELEEKLIELAPVFKKLKNPVMRKTIAKVTSLKQASVVGNINIGVLITELRKAAGIEQPFMEEQNNKPYENNKPSWASVKNAAVIYDARHDLENGVHPLAKVMKETSELKDNAVYLLITPFTPAPLIEKLQQKGFEVYSCIIAPGDFGTFARRLNTEE
jgi:hypothetical protein